MTARLESIYRYPVKGLSPERLSAVRLEPGQRVSIEPGVPCRHCRQCLAGRYNLCPDVRFFATPPYDGAFSQYLVMPAEFVFPVPPNVRVDDADSSAEILDTLKRLEADVAELRAQLAATSA